MVPRLAAKLIQMDNAPELQKNQRKLTSMARLKKTPESNSIAHLKRTACKLFAERGVDGVTVREIAMAAGQKNHGAVGYHFGSKESLVQALILDGAIAIDQRRNAMLDAIEARGGPKSVYEVVEALIYPSIGLAEDSRDKDSYVSFVIMLSMTHRELFIETLANRWNSGYLRCLEHLRTLMPEMPLAAKNQRFVFMGGLLGSVLAMRERALADKKRPHPTWSAEHTLHHLTLCMSAMLEAPIDAQSMHAASGDGGDKKTIPAMLGFIE
jgi:AcrR family transcriptional regulator